MTAIRTASIAAAMLAAGLIATACGGPQPGHRQPSRVDQGLAYSSCMRAHGVPNFPDPVHGANGHVSINLGAIDPNSPQAHPDGQAGRAVTQRQPAVDTVAACQADLARDIRRHAGVCGRRRRRGQRD
jgi:hypothetical protein